MVELETVTLEDGLNYVIISNLNSNNITYVYLAEENNEKNCCIRKINNSIDKNTIIPLDSEEELLEALNLFKKTVDINS